MSNQRLVMFKHNIDMPNEDMRFSARKSFVGVMLVSSLFILLCGYDWTKMIGNDLHTKPWTCIVPLAWFILAGFVFYKSQPWLILLDTTSKQYQLATGFWPMKTVSAGSFNDFYCIRLVRRYHGDGPDGYMLTLALKRSHSQLVLKRHENFNEARRYGIELAERLGVPCLVKSVWIGEQWSGGKLVSHESMSSDDV